MYLLSTLSGARVFVCASSFREEKKLSLSLLLLVLDKNWTWTFTSTFNHVSVLEKTDESTRGERTFDERTRERERDVRFSPFPIKILDLLLSVLTQFLLQRYRNLGFLASLCMRSELNIVQRS